MGAVQRLVFFLVALTFTLYVWLGGGIVASWLAPWAPWMALLMLEAVLVLPEQGKGESLFEARKRVWRGVVRDPLTWVSLALVVFLVVQWLNACAFLEWSPVERAWKVVSPAFAWLRPEGLEQVMAQRPSKPELVSYLPLLGSQPVKWLPWSLRADEARGVLNWFVPSLMAFIAVRHALLKRTKRLLMSWVCVMSAVLSIAGIVQFAVDGTFLYWGREVRAFFFATFGYPNHAASYFTAVMALCAGMTLWSAEHKEKAPLPAWVYGVSGGLCAVGAVLSGSRAGVLLTVAVALAVAVLVPVRYFGAWSTRWRVGVPVAIGLGLLLSVGTLGFRMYASGANKARSQAIASAQTMEERQAAVQLPQFAPIPALDAVCLEIAETPWAEVLAHPMLVRSGYQGILALRQAADYPWFGSGAWSFRWLNERYINRDSPEEQTWLQSRLGVGQANVHNDTLQFLAEHGRIGFGLMVAVMVLLLVPFLVGLFRSPGRVVSDEQADRSWFNRLNAYHLFALLAVAMMTLHSFMDLVFRSPACLMLYGLLMLCAEGFEAGKRPEKPQPLTPPTQPGA